jgi:putative flavoprotein involved in K+ transport
VMVVGASATGVQLADEIHRSGRPVVLAVGEHVRMPRTYRGRDVLWWMEEAGVWSERWDTVDDIVRARGVPSPQLVGTPQRTTLDLNTLTAAGVELVGRLSMIRDGAAQFSGGLRNQCALADLKLGRLLDTIDAWAERAGVDPGAGADGPQRFAPTSPGPAPLSVRLGTGKVETIVWATGFRPDLSWLDAGVFDRRGRVVHDGGVTASPGLYLMGLPFLRRRKSTLIDGAAADACELADHLVAHLDAATDRRAS